MQHEPDNYQPAELAVDVLACAVAAFAVYALWIVLP